MTDIIQTRFEWRRGTAAQWATANPVLLDGEPGRETDTGKWKLGDGVTAWNSLPYQAGDEAALSATYASHGELVIRPEDHGAKGDFSTDDTAAMQAAVDAAADAGGGTVLLARAGRYTVSQLRMKTGVTLAGQGSLSRIFQANAAAGHLIILDTSAVTDVTIRDLTLNGGKANQTNANAGIYLDHTGATDTTILPRHRILNVAVRSTKGDGVYLGYLTRCTFVNNLSIYGADGYGITLAGADSQLSNVDVASSGKDGFNITSGAYVLNATKSWTSGRIDGAGSGYLIAAPTVSICGAHAQENQGNGFRVFKSGTAITGLAMTGILSDSNNASGVGYTELYLYNVQGAVIRGETIKAAGIGGTVPSGLGLVGGSAACDITLGISGQSSWAVSTDSAVSSNTVRVNGREGRLFAQSYAATINVNPWTAETWSVTLTGNATVANPGVKPAGLRLRFIFTQDATGGRTVTFGADFKTNWAPVTTANKVNVIEFVCNGTNWVQVSATTGL